MIKKNRKQTNKKPTCIYNANIQKQKLTVFEVFLTTSNILDIYNILQ